MPNAFGYVHESSPRTLGEQWSVIVDYCQRDLEPADIVLHKQGVFADPPESRLRDFRQRKFVSLCLRQCKPGDVVVVSSMAAFRNHADYLDAQSLAMERRIELHVAERNPPANPAEQRIRQELLEELAEAEIERKREVAQERYAECRKQGKAIGRPPVGMRWIGPRGRRRWLADKREGEIMRAIRELSAKGRPLDEIYWQLLTHGLRRRGGQEWSRTTIWEVVQANADARAEA